MKPAWGWVVLLLWLALGASAGCNSSGYRLLEGPHRSIAEHSAVAVGAFDFSAEVWVRNQRYTTYARECAGIFNTELRRLLEEDAEFRLAEDRSAATLVMRSEFTIFRPARHGLTYTVGFGAGRAAIEVTVEFVDAATGTVVATGIVRAVQGRGMNALWYNTGRMLLDCAAHAHDMLHDAAERPPVAPGDR